MNIQTVAKMLGINQNLVNQVLNQSKNYSQDMNGLIQAINDNGGMAQVDRAMQQLNNPIVRRGLNLIGLSTQQIQDVYSSLKNMQNANNSVPTNKQSNNYSERLKRLK